MLFYAAPFTARLLLDRSVDRSMAAGNGTEARIKQAQLDARQSSTNSSILGSRSIAAV